jgi:hypothetical protein
MTQIINIASKRRLSARLLGGLAVSALLALGTFATPAHADWNGDQREYHHNWNGGYYRAPPVVYGSPYYGGGYNGYYGSPYYAPPVVYGPGIGINLPGVNIGIR